MFLVVNTKQADSDGREVTKVARLSESGESTCGHWGILSRAVTWQMGFCDVAS